MGTDTMDDPGHQKDGKKYKPTVQKLGEQQEGTRWGSAQNG